MIKIKTDFDILLVDGQVDDAKIAHQYKTTNNDGVTTHTIIEITGSYNNGVNITEYVNTYVMEYRKLATGGSQWLLNGKLHREAGPAEIQVSWPYKMDFTEWKDPDHDYNNSLEKYTFGGSTVEIWYANGEKHRIGAPAETSYDDTGTILHESWFVTGVQYRDGGAPTSSDLKWDLKQHGIDIFDIPDIDKTDMMVRYLAKNTVALAPSELPPFTDMLKEYHYKKDPLGFNKTIGMTKITAGWDLKNAITIFDECDFDLSTPPISQLVPTDEPLTGVVPTEGVVQGTKGILPPKKFKEEMIKKIEEEHRND